MSRNTPPAKEAMFFQEQYSKSPGKQHNQNENHRGDTRPDNHQKGMGGLHQGAAPQQGDSEGAQAGLAYRHKARCCQ